MAIIQTEICKTIAEFTVTKVHGQPTNLEVLIVVASSIPTSLGGENKGHASMLLSPVDYIILAPGPGAASVVPNNPGVYPASAATANCA